MTVQEDRDEPKLARAQSRRTEDIKEAAGSRMFMTVQSVERTQVKEYCRNSYTGRHDEEHSLNTRTDTDGEEENSEVTQRAHRGNRIAQYK